MKLNIKLSIISIIAGLFIYNRTIDYYAVLPRKNIKSTIFIILITYLILLEPYLLIPFLFSLKCFEKEFALVFGEEG